MVEVKKIKSGRPAELSKELIAETEKYLVETSMFLPAALLPSIEALAPRLRIS